MAEAVEDGPAGLLLNEETQLVPEGLPKEAIDNGVEAAVGESCQVDDVACEWVVMPQGSSTSLRWVCCALEQLDADKDVLRQPADEEHQHHHHNHSQGLLPPWPQATVLLGLHQDAHNQGVTKANDGKGHQEANGHLQPLNLKYIGKAKVHLSPVLCLHNGEGEQGGQDGCHPDEATAKLSVLHGPQRAAAHGAGQGHIAVKAHPCQKEDTAVHVHLQEQGHKGAKDSVIIVFLIQIEDLDEGIGHQNEVSYSQVDKVKVRDGHLLSVIQVDHQDQDVTNKSNRKEEDGVQTGEEETNKVVLVLV